MEFVCFGEIMGRLNPEGYGRLAQMQTLSLSYGGSEANVAVSLANYGKQAVYVTKVPENEISKAAMNSLALHNVDVSRVIYGGDRLGLYFIEKGASQRPSKVIYDRKNSSISTAQKGDFDWRKILHNAEWFHFTGITPALSDTCAEICLEACRVAKELGITVSCDLNFRKNLWDSKKAGQVMSMLMPYVDVVIANEEDCEKVFGITADNTDISGGALSKEGYKTVAKTLSERFEIPTVAITLRESLSANDNRWSAMLYNQGGYSFSKSYPLHVVDRVGGGDSFGSGLIYALSEGKNNQHAIDFAVAASALKHSVENDFNEVSITEAETLMGGDGSGRVQR